jgi:hypothetical protein
MNKSKKLIIIIEKMQKYNYKKTALKCKHAKYMKKIHQKIYIYFSVFLFIIFYFIIIDSRF